MRSAWVVMASWRLFSASDESPFDQNALPGADDDRVLVLVGRVDRRHRGAPAPDLGERAVAAVGHDPGGVVDGGDAVGGDRAEQALARNAQRPHGPLAR